MPMNQNKASLKSQLCGEACTVADTKEISELRKNGDYESLKKLGGLLVSQYRYKDALIAFEEAKKLNDNEVFLYFLLGGTYLTLLRFDEAEEMYKLAFQKGASEKQTSFYLGFLCFCKGEFEKSSEYFKKGLPCDDETKISLIYWDMLASQNCSKTSSLVQLYDECIDIGHHKSYKLAVSVMLGLKDADEALKELESEESDLDFVIAAFGISQYFLSAGKKKEGEKLLCELFEKESVWPSSAYLAAYVLSNK